MKAITELGPNDAMLGDRIELLHAQGTESFIVTVFGRFALYVSLSHGFAYTRPQLIDKYRKVGATFTITRA